MTLSELNYARVHSVIWLSLNHAVKVIYRTYHALVVGLSNEANSNASIATAKGLFDEVSQYEFIIFPTF